MKTRALALAAAALLLCGSVAVAADQLKVTIKNPLSSARSGEMVEVALEVVKSRMGTTNVIVTDADGREIPSQQTYEGLLIWQVAVGGNSSSIYYIKKGTAQTYEQKVHGRKFPERADDVAWENDLVAFRCYGPQLQRNGEKAYGYDVWNKRTDKLVIEERYASELNAETAAQIASLRAEGKNDEADDLYNSVSYHVDHGTGMDCYKVGPTLGAGATALLTYDDSHEIIYPYCYETCEVLDDGPLRFTVKLVYEKKDYSYGEGYALESTQETRILTLDAGSQMNRVRVSYSGLSRTVPAAVGIVVHPENPNAFVLSQQNHYMGYEDLGDPNQYKEKYRATQNADFGKIYVGAVFKQQPTGMEYRALEGVSGTSGHILGLTEVGPWRQLTYYFGSGWSRNPATSFQSLTDWEAYLSDFAQRVRNPLEVVM